MDYDDIHPNIIDEMEDEMKWESIQREQQELDDAAEYRFQMDCDDPDMNPGRWE